MKVHQFGQVAGDKAFVKGVADITVDEVDLGFDATGRRIVLGDFGSYIQDHHRLDAVDDFLFEGAVISGGRSDGIGPAQLP